MKHIKDWSGNIPREYSENIKLCVYNKNGTQLVTTLNGFVLPKQISSVVTTDSNGFTSNSFVVCELLVNIDGGLLNLTNALTYRNGSLFDGDKEIEGLGEVSFIDGKGESPNKVKFTEYCKITDSIIE